MLLICGPKKTDIPSDDYCEREGGWTEKQTFQLIVSTDQETGGVKTSLLVASPFLKC